MKLENIYHPIRHDLEKVEKKLKIVSQVKFPYLSELLDFSLRSNGKRIRPILTLLAGKFYPTNLDSLLLMATSVEIMHTATLVHDDAIDKSIMRRGRPTVYKVWGEEKAVLLGDFLFAEAGALTAATKNMRAISLFADTLKAISSGELNQAFNAFNLNQSCEQYFQRVSQKTAALFIMAVESGSALSQAPEESIQVLIEYGRNLGIAFQIVDDILDYIGTEEELGKPVCSDLAQGTLTLPAMLLLKRYPNNNPIENLCNNRGGKGYINLAMDMIRNSSITDECYQIASNYCALACKNLNKLPNSENRYILTELAGYVVRRKV